MDHPQALVNAIALGKCFLFIGSGLSRFSNSFPIWSELIDQMFDEVKEGVNFTINDAQEYRFEFLEYIKRERPTAYDEVLERCLTNDAAYIHDIHKTITEFDWKGILTTNLDTLIEEAYDQCSAEIIRISTDEEAHSIGIKTGVEVIKMHGTLKDRSSHVMTQTDYLQYENNHPTINSIVQSRFAQYPFLVIGAGLTDPNFVRLNDSVHRKLGGYKHPAFYVNEPIPEFVESIWSQRNFNFIKIRHNELDKWLNELRILVSQEQLRLKSRSSVARVDKAVKQNYFAELGRNTQIEYGQLQETYTFSIQLNDYSTFNKQWESTLYSNLRYRVNRVMSRWGGRDRGTFLYCAPGPHAPLFSNKNSSRKIRSKVRHIAAVDISRAIVDSAIDAITINCGEHKPTVTTSALVCDLTLGLGEKFSESLEKTLMKSEYKEVITDLEILETNLSVWFEELTIEDKHKISDDEESYDYVYSEMIAAFSVTPSVMAFRSMLYKSKTGRFSRNQIQEILGIMSKCWRSFNDKFYNLHLSHLSSHTNEGGCIMVAYDTTKIFDDEEHESVESFSAEFDDSTPAPFLQKQQMDNVNTFYWIDHDGSYETKIGNEIFNDFCSHKHEIHFSVYRKTTANQ